MQDEKIYLGLDIGSDSVGYAVTDGEYNILKYHGKPAWGVTLFDAAAPKADRRSFRTARRRLDRRQQRVQLIRELFAGEIAKVDPKFYIRLQAAALYREEAGEAYTIFNDVGYTDREYHVDYPTVHHLIYELMTDSKPHDVRLVYLACAWLVAHRGHFLSNVSKDNLASIKDFSIVYEDFMNYFSDNEYAFPWHECDVAELGKKLKVKSTVTAKKKALVKFLYGTEKPSKEASEDFPFSREAIVGLLAGGKVKPKELFQNDEYAEMESISLGMDDEKYDASAAALGDDFELLSLMRSIYDWAVLADILADGSCISEAKVAVYERHKADLRLLKDLIAQYRPEKYREVFRDTDKSNYAAYVYHTDEKECDKFKKKNKEDFSRYILGIVKGIVPKDEDKEKFDDMLARLEARTFMPKQKDSDNRVIPQQLYWYELDRILKNAAGYLPFLAEADEDGLTAADKIESVFSFRVPYFVGPLNPNSDRAWLDRKAGKIYPWNFEKMVDLDASEKKFIDCMTNTCSHLPGEPVLPKDSLLYHKFTVLNEINNLRINGERISVELKQRIYNELFLAKKKVTKKSLLEYLIRENIIANGDEYTVSGIDININSNLVPQIAFKNLLGSSVITEADAEEIIKRLTYSEDKARFKKWLEKEYPNISETDRKYICSLKFKDFGRLSRTLLCGMEGVCKETGEVMTVIGALWETQYNLMEIIADDSRFTFKAEIEAFKADYYCNNPKTLQARLDEMYISNSVRRPIYRTLAIVKDVEKAFGKPDKIFIEVTRGATDEQKGKRTKTRKQQILELYDKCSCEDVPMLREQIESMGDLADNKLQSDRLFLYYMQLGRCLYTGRAIKLEELGSKLYDIEHIYPQAYVKDDSIINNEILVDTKANGEKSDVYPISSDIRRNMAGFWHYLKDHEFISEEKYKRLTRATGFTAEEKYGFINRQLTETSQSTKAVANLLHECYPDADIVYSKARLVSDFRQEFDLLKSRLFNDLHHAVDAYLNIVVGNVYKMKFNRSWFNVNSKYSVKTRTMFTHPLVCAGETVWDGEKMLAKVKANAVKNNANVTKYSFMRHGGFFDQNPLPASEGLTPLKKDLPTEKYGGYNKPAVMFFIPVRYKAGRKSEIIIMSVELLYGKEFLADAEFARTYTFDRLRRILGKPVDEVSFPLGMRPWKINTMLSLDGFRVCITGSANAGKSIIPQTVTQFSANGFWQFYLKKLESFVDKVAKNPEYHFSEKYDKISAEKNLELYDIYIDKLENSIYKRRFNNPVEILKNGRDKFIELDIKAQAKQLLNAHQVFGRLSSGCDLEAIGGKTRSAATIGLSTVISNWKKYYKDVRIIDSSASGLWERTSGNLLELL